MYHVLPPSAMENDLWRQGFVSMAALAGVVGGLGELKGGLVAVVVGGLGVVGDGLGET